VALGHGLNANLVRKWINADRFGRRNDDASSLPVALIPVSVSDSPQRPARGDCIVMPALELRVGKVAVSLLSGATAEQLRAIVQALQ
jgi:transposase-like protein